MTGKELLERTATIVRDRRRGYRDPAERFERVAIR